MSDLSGISLRLLLKLRFWSDFGTKITAELLFKSYDETNCRPTGLFGEYRIRKHYRFRTSSGNCGRTCRAMKIQPKTVRGSGELACRSICCLIVEIDPLAKSCQASVTLVEVVSTVIESSMHPDTDNSSRTLMKHNKEKLLLLYIGYEFSCFCKKKKKDYCFQIYS